MSATELTGGCQCGAVRYTVRTASTPVVYACHCRECQKQSASAFALSVPVAIEDVEFEGGMEVYERDTDSGNRTQCYFCPRCGARVYHRSCRNDALITIKAGSLDRPGELELVAHLWVRSKLPWVMIPSDIPSHQTQPEDFNAWREDTIHSRREL